MNQLLKQFKEAQAMLKSPGALGGMLGMGGGQFEQALAASMSGAEGLDGLSLPAAGAAQGMNLGEPGELRRRDPRVPAAQEEARRQGHSERWGPGPLT